MSGVLATEDLSRFPAAAGTAPHDLAGHSLFDDQALAQLLDAVPRANVQVFTMGTDAARTDQWRRGSAGDVAGTDLLAAARRGRLWFNVLRVHEVDAQFAALVQDLFENLAQRVPGLDVQDARATVLISSPGAQVYYHADAQPNLLWHVRGRKRVWVYPALDERFATRAALGRIYTGEADEQLPYDPAWDAEAEVLDVSAGEVAWWPQNAPHRVVNVEGFNVSLSTEYVTPGSNRRVHVGAADHLLQSRLGVTAGAGRSLPAPVRSLAYRAVRRTGLLTVPARQRPVTFVVSADDERGWVETASTGDTSHCDR